MRSNPVRSARERGRVLSWLMAAAVLAGLAVLVGLGTWQLHRLEWKQELLANVEARLASPPLTLAEVEDLYARTANVDYQPVRAKGRFDHRSERHFFATWQGQSGFFVHTPLRLADGRFLFVNRGFVPYDQKDPATRRAGQVEGERMITGLARNPVEEKPSFLVPDNDPSGNLFYWKDLAAMAGSAGLPDGAQVLPFLVDAGPSEADEPGPRGGVTIVSFANDHLQYALTWYGLAATLVLVLIAHLRHRRERARR